MLHVANFAVGQSKPVDVSDSSAHDFRLHRSETHLNQRNASSERPPWRPNAEVEGPGDHAPWRRGRTISQRPRRQAAGASRPPRTIVSSRMAPTRVLLRSVSRNGNRQPNDSLRSFTELGNGSGHALWRAPTVSGYSTRLSCDCWSAEQ